MHQVTWLDSFTWIRGRKKQDGYINIRYMRTTILLIVLVGLASCTTAKRCAQKFPTVAQRDSIYIETLQKIPIYLPGDTILIDIPIDCPDQEVGTIETDRLKQVITILNKRLQSLTTIKADTVIRYVTKTETIVKEVTKPVEVRYVPRFVKFLSWVGVASVLGLVVLIALKIGKLGTWFKKIMGS
jgi:hypothetical protein